MKTAPRIATAVAVGYVLGRTRRMKLAITIGGMLAGRRLAPDPKAAAEKLVSSPQVVSLTNELRGKLLEAVRSAATAAASSQIENLGDRLTERAESLRTPRKSGRAEAEEEKSAEASEPADEPESTSESETSSEPATSARSESGQGKERSGRSGGERARRAAGSRSASTGQHASHGRPQSRAKPDDTAKSE